jgi:hypothetical protein
MPVDVDTKDINAVCEECDRIYRSTYGDADGEFMSWACGWFQFIFSGQYKDYLPIDVPYHDREHTMQGLLCLVRLLHGRCEAGAEPPVPRRGFELGVLAILLHDSGYLKYKEDVDGTGAKYTLVHVDRSRKFAKGFLSEQGCTASEIEAVRNMILCTSTDLNISDIPFSSPVERTVGCALATADLIGQMSADDYVDRLPQLYAEFKESYDYFGERAQCLYYGSAEALIANTPQFWESYVKPKLEQSCGGLYRFLAEPYPDGENVYLSRIQANIDRAARLACN